MSRRQPRARPGRRHQAVGPRPATASAGPNARLVQPAGDQQQRVVQRLGVEAHQRHPREQGVVRVERSPAPASRPNSAGRSALVIMQPVHRLDAPALRGRTRRASQSSSSGCVGGAPALPKLPSVVTMPVPKWCFQRRLTIDAGRQRVVGLRQPAGERQPPAGLLRPGPRRLHLERRLAVGQHRRHARPDEPAGAERVAAAVDVRRRRLAAVPQRLDAFGSGQLARLRPSVDASGVASPPSALRAPPSVTCGRCRPPQHVLADRGRCPAGRPA